MAQNGSYTHNHLNPTAQEFRPIYPNPNPNPAHLQQFPILIPPHPFYQHPPPAYVTPRHQQAVVVVPPSLPPAAAAAPTRAILLSSVPPHDVSESTIRRDLEIFGDVRAVQMERVRDSIVTVHFYDLRAACAAHDAVREQHMQHQHRLRIHYTSLWSHNNNNNNNNISSLIGLDVGPPPPLPPPGPGLVLGRAVWAQFAIPATNAFPDGNNQGTIVVFNLDPNVSALTLHNIFQAFGAVKELRETPMKRQQRFIEFYDVRDASRALIEMNGKEINGRSVIIEFSRPGGISHRKHQHHQLKKSEAAPPAAPQRMTSPRTQGSKPRRCFSSSEESLETTRVRISSTLSLRDNVKTTNITTSGGSRKQVKSGGKGWKGSRHKNSDPRFMIREDAILNASVEFKDTRTTVMIKNIPNKYSQKLLLNMLDNHCIHCNEQISNAVGGEDQPLSSYDFVYLPIDFNNKCNVGYGFVNMTSPEATLRLYKAFHHQHWEVFNSRKICEVTYARVQGLEALKEHFKNSKFACENDEYLPVVFTPPRDGRNLTHPLPIVFSPQSQDDQSSSSHIHHDHDDDDHFTSTSTTPTTAPSSLDFPHCDNANDNDNDDNGADDDGDSDGCSE